jgi:HPt (histidine-containing phosphotransfer) domain-containing protein
MPEAVDLDTLTMLKDIMEDEFDLLIETFIDDAKVRIPQLKKQLAEGEHDELMRNAHSLKGSSSNLGAIPFSEKCMKVESQAKEGNLNGLEGALSDIEQEFNLVESALKELI